MKLTDKTLALLVEGDPAEVEVLHFVRSPPISQVGHSSLHRCRRLVSLSLARLGLLHSRYVLTSALTPPP